MSAHPEPLCYVAMPFGMRTGPRGWKMDFDELYHDAIVPAIEELGLRPMRADTLETVGILANAILDTVLGAEYMIADVSHATPSVLYELGVRHALRRSGTVIICSSDDELPFDISRVQAIRYATRNGAIDAEGKQALSGALAAALQAAQAAQTDSPIWERFAGLSVSLPSTLPARVPADLLRRSLTEAQKLPLDLALEKINDVERAMLRDHVTDRTLLTDVMFAYRDLSAWSDVVRVARALPTELRNDREVVQQLALALNRSGESSAAERELVGLIERTGGDSESYGLLGRVFKDVWRRTGSRGDLDRAIDAYRRGFELERGDYYPGINLATLLALRGDPDATSELEHLLPELRGRVDEIVNAGQADYWELATSLELAVLDGDILAAAELVEPALARAAWDWMTQTTASNLELLASSRVVESSPELEAIIDRLGRGQRLEG